MGRCIHATGVNNQWLLSNEDLQVGSTDQVLLDATPHELSFINVPTTTSIRKFPTRSWQSSRLDQKLLDGFCGIFSLLQEGKEYNAFLLKILWEAIAKIEQ